MRIVIAEGVVEVTVDQKSLAASFKKATSKFTSFASGVQKKLASISFKKAIIAVTAFGVAASAALFKVTKAAAEQERIFRTLRTQIELHGIAWADVKGKIDDYAASLQKTTKYGDTDTAQVLQKILVFTGDLDQAFIGAKLSMDLAASGLFDVTTAARMVGMALSGNIEMLGRYIAEFKTSNNETLKAMTLTEKAAFAIETLQKKFGGAAETELATFLGKLQQMKNFLGDIVEYIGDKFLPTFTSVVGSVTNWIQVNDELIKQKIDVTVAKIVEKATAATEAFTKWYEANQKHIQSTFVDWITKVKDALVAIAGIAQTHGDIIGKIFVVGTLTIVIAKLWSLAAALGAIAMSPAFGVIAAFGAGYGIGKLLMGAGNTVEDKLFGFKGFGGGKARGGRGTGGGFGDEAAQVAAQGIAVPITQPTARGGGGGFTGGLGIGGMGIKGTSPDLVQGPGASLASEISVAGFVSAERTKTEVLRESFRIQDELMAKETERYQATIAQAKQFGDFWGGWLFDMANDADNFTQRVLNSFVNMFARIGAQATAAGVFNLVTQGPGGFSGAFTRSLGFPSEAGVSSKPALGGTTVVVNGNDHQLAGKIVAIVDDSNRNFANRERF